VPKNVDAIAIPAPISLLRIVAQGLVPATAAGSAHEAVRQQLAMQGQRFTSSLDAVAVRTAGGTTRGVREAFNRGELVRSWPMRGTVHVTTTEDHHWLRLALAGRRDALQRRRELEYGIDDALLAKAAELAYGLMAPSSAGQMPTATRASLLEAWRSEGLMRHEGQSDIQGSYRRALLLGLHHEGYLVQGPLAGNDSLMIDARSLPDASSGPGSPTGGAVHAGDPAALAEIARRFATSHGPITADDLARWTGLSKTQAKRALDAAISESDHPGAEAFDGSRMVPLLRMTGEQLVALAHSVAGGRASSPAPAGDFVLRADLADLAAQSLPQARRTLALPAFDELHVGYRDRSCLTDELGEKLICPSKNGMFRPILVDRGRLVAAIVDGQPVWGEGQPGSARLEHSAELALTRVAKRQAL